MDEVIVTASAAVVQTYTSCFSKCCYHVVYGVHMDLLSHVPLLHTPLVSANADNMRCMECVWISYCMRLLDRAPVRMGGEVFFANRVFGSGFSLESLGWLRGCRAGSRSGRPCMNASIAVPRGGAWSASHPWSADLT